MPSMNALVAYCLVATLAVNTAFAFVVAPVSMLHVSSRNSNGANPVASWTSRQLRSHRSIGALRMAEGDTMEAAQEKAKRLTEQANALREAAASSEAEIRPPSEDAGAGAATPAAEAAAEPRPEDLPPPQKISNDMKDRLRKELVSQGADPNKSAGNPILIVAAVIAVLVVAGGKGIFY